MPDGRRVYALIAIFLTTFFWGISYSSTKLLLGSLTPAQIVFFRLVLAMMILVLVFFGSRQKLARGKDLLKMIGGGFTGIFLYFLFETTGLRFTNAGTAALIISIIPVLNMIAGFLIFRERYSPRRWSGVFLSFVGVYLIIGAGTDGALSLANLQGNFLVFLAACSWVVFTRINEPLSHRYNSVTINFHQSLTGMILLGLLVLPRGVDPALFSSMVIFNLAFLGIFCSAAAFFLYLYALKALGSATVTTFLNLIPVFGVLGGVIILGETMASGKIFGALTVFAGIIMVTVGGRDNLLASRKINL
jgi:drug/metabolite transporter (DMT)-like permease